MTNISWEIKAREFANCNCDYGCPCQFNALPTHGSCEAVAGFDIKEGHFGETRLDGLRAVYMAKWPGPVHEGNGTAQVIIDKRANEAQREALRKIMYGEETEPGATMFNVFMSMTTKVYDPLYRDIHFEVDVDNRRAELKVKGLVESKGEPILNPVTGAEHRARINLDHGFEYITAEMGSGTSKVTGDIPLDMTASYGQFANIHLSTQGIVK
jgi:hypothetical protein